MGGGALPFFERYFIIKLSFFREVFIMKITHGKKTVTWVLAAALLFASFFPDNSLSKVNAATGGNSIES